MGNAASIVPFIGKLLIVKSNPSELPIYVDEKYRGKTPESITGLNVGRHEVCVKNGETKWEAAVETIQSGSVTVYADFSQKEPTETETSTVDEDENKEEEEEFSEEELLKMYGITKKDEDEGEPEQNTSENENEKKTIIDTLIEFVTSLSPF